MRKAVKLERRHFEFIAETIKFMSVDDATKLRVALEFERALRGTNGMFQSDRFLRACGAEKLELAS